MVPKRIFLADMSKQEIIKELLDLWYECITPTHHKDRDTRFSINTNYCAYRDVEYVVEHHGYILHHLPIYSTFKTLEEAEKCLIDLLVHGILGEIDSALSDSDDVFFDLSVERANEIKLALNGLADKSPGEINFERARNLK